MRREPALRVADGAAQNSRHGSEGLRFAVDPAPWALWEAVVVFAAAAVVCLVATRFMSPMITHNGLDDIWFESDMVRSYRGLFDRHWNQIFPAKHPMYAMVSWLIITPIHAIVASKIESLNIMLALNAGVFTALLSRILAYDGVARVERFAVAAVTVASSAFWMWFTVPDKFAFAATTLLIGIYPLARAQAGRTVPLWQWVVCAAASFSITVTNFIAGGVAALTRALLVAPDDRLFPLSLTARIRSVALILAAAAALVGVGSLTQNRLYPGSGLMFSPHALAIEGDYMFRYDVSSLAARVQTLIVQPVVMGVPGRAGPTRRTNGRYGELDARQKVDGKWPGTSYGRAAAAIWVALLGIGVWAALRPATRTPIGIAAAAMVAWQFGLHLVYGEQAFLYMAHFLPFDMILLAKARLPLRRPIFVGLCALLAVTAALNSVDGLRAASAISDAMGRDLIAQASAPDASPRLAASVLRP